MKARAKKTASIVTVLAVVGIIYFFIYRRLGFGIPCVFYELTGLKCPGCGSTKLCASLLMLDFASAFNSNPCIFVMLPLLAYFLIKYIYCYIRWGRVRFNTVENIILIIMIIALLIFGVLRNIL